MPSCCNNIREQDFVKVRLEKLFETTKVIDRRDRPSHGYRALHVIVEMNGKSVEVQVRTELQHWWANLSEKFSDLVEPAIKYGGGDTQVLEALSVLSNQIGSIEHDEKYLYGLMLLGKNHEWPQDIARDIVRAQEAVATRKERLVKLIESHEEVVAEAEDGVSDSI